MCVFHLLVGFAVCVLFFKQKTAYEMRISDWSSDVCSSDLLLRQCEGAEGESGRRDRQGLDRRQVPARPRAHGRRCPGRPEAASGRAEEGLEGGGRRRRAADREPGLLAQGGGGRDRAADPGDADAATARRRRGRPRDRKTTRLNYST